MPIDVSVEGSPGWWFRRLSLALFARSVGERRSRRERMDLLWSYAVGEPPLPRWNEHHAEDTREFLKMARQRYALVVIEALAHRTRLLGVRTSQDQDADGDDVAREIAEASGFKAVSADAFLYQYALGEGYFMVNPPDPVNGHELPVFTAEDPRHVITAQDPLRPLVTRAGLKVYTDEDRDLDVAHVFTPGRVDVATRKRVGVWSQRFTPTMWEWDESLSGPYPPGMDLENVVPLVKLPNRLGVGEYEPHLDLLNRLNNGIADRLWTAKRQAFKQLAIIGDTDDPDVDEDGEPIEADENDVLSSDPGAVWRFPQGMSLWESGALDIGPLLNGTKEDVRELASVTSTPMYAFTPDSADGSAEGATLQREAITFKADDRNARNTPRVAYGWRIALRMAGQKERAAGFVQPVWAPVERYSLQARGAAAVQAKTSGMPWRSLMSDVWQQDPETVARMEAERDSDLLQAATQQAVQAGTPPAQPEPAAAPPVSTPPAPTGG